MITRAEFNQARQRATEMLQRTGIAIRPEEIAEMEVADFGLSELDSSGVQILTLVSTDRIAAKVLVLFPHQTEPEHMHPRIGDYQGKEETIRCQSGELYLYSSGDPTPHPQAQPPLHRRQMYKVWHEHVLRPGDQFTLKPNVPHWFQAGPDGAVIWSISTTVRDVSDIFTDQEVHRETIIRD